MLFLVNSCQLHCKDNLFVVVVLFPKLNNECFISQQTTQSLYVKQILVTVGIHHHQRIKWF